MYIAWRLNAQVPDILTADDKDWETRNKGFGSAISALSLKSTQVSLIDAYVRTYTQNVYKCNIHSYIHTYTLTHIHIHIHTYIHTYTAEGDPACVGHRTEKSIRGWFSVRFICKYVLCSNGFIMFICIWLFSRGYGWT